MKKIKKAGYKLGMGILGFLTAVLNATESIFEFLNSKIKAIPAKGLSLISGFTSWLRRKLDHWINKEQRHQLHRIIFETDTPEGRRFDTILIWLIALSVLTVMLETVPQVSDNYWWFFYVLEWLFTIIFTLEYLLRLYCAKKPVKYATSFYGVVDLLSFLPTYLSIFLLGAQYLLVVRVLRLLRIFRIFKMGHFVSEGELVINALKASKVKIYVFLSFVVLLATLIGTALFMVEGGHNPDVGTIPKGIYWAIVTLTTVGYGDVTPITPLGQMLATAVMILGYGVIAVPTGIVTAEISGRVMNLKEVIVKECPNCSQTEHHTHATFCHRCGVKL